MLNHKLFLSLGAAALLSSASAWADVCVAPGDIVITDPVGDVVGEPIPPDPISGAFDLQSLAIATPAADSSDAQTVVFTIKTGGEPLGFTPGSGIFISFEDPRKLTRGLRAEGDSTGGISFFSYVVSADNDGEFGGQFIEDGSQVPADGSYAADGTLTITVNAKTIGIRDTGDVISGFNGGGILLVGTPDTASLAFNLDSMPDDQGRGAATPVVFSPCAKSLSKAGSSLLAGTMPLAGLLLMGLLALARRRV